MSKEIIQFDQAMFESKLDAMAREKVERIVNAMPDASAGPAIRRELMHRVQWRTADTAPRHQPPAIVRHRRSHSPLTRAGQAP